MDFNTLMDSTPLAPHPLARTFEDWAPRDFAEEPLYLALCRCIARSPTALALLDEAPPTQRRGNLILAALHDLVLRSADSGQAAGEPLAAYYASAGGTRAPDAALPAALAACLQRHGDALRPVLRQQRTQTNEIGRCAVLRPALDAIARRHGRRALALFDFGCSAGLNLLVDRYAIGYQHLPDGRLHSVGPEDALATRLACTWYGALPPDGLPRTADWQLVARQGCDQMPLDLRQPAAQRWLQACLWPADTARRERLASASRQFLAAPPAVQAAEDGLAWLREVWLPSLPTGCLPVLFNSWVLAYLTPEDLARHTQQVQALVQSHGLVWLSAEDGARTQATSGLAPPEQALEGEARADAGSHTFWTLCEPGPDGPTQRLLARSHPHGRWLHWLGEDGG